MAQRNRENLLAACRSGNLNWVKLADKKAASVDLQAGLSIASELGHVSVVEYLLTAYHLPVDYLQWKRLGVIKYVWNHYQSHLDWLQVVMKASESDDLEGFKWLLDQHQVSGGEVRRLIMYTSYDSAFALVTLREWILTSKFALRPETDKKILEMVGSMTTPEQFPAIWQKLKDCTFVDDFISAFVMNWSTGTQTRLIWLLQYDETLVTSMVMQTWWKRYTILWEHISLSPAAIPWYSRKWLENGIFLSFHPDDICALLNHNISLQQVKNAEELSKYFMQHHSARKTKQCLLQRILFRVGFCVSWTNVAVVGYVLFE